MTSFGSMLSRYGCNWSPSMMTNFWKPAAPADPTGGGAAVPDSSVGLTSAAGAAEVGEEKPMMPREVLSGVSSLSCWSVSRRACRPCLIRVGRSPAPFEIK